MKAWNRVAVGGAALTSVGAYWGLAYATPRTNFPVMCALFGALIAAYIILLRSGLSWKSGLGLAVTFRLLWMLATPALSDDYFRFRWDGLLVANGLSPFQFRPSELIDSPPSAASISPALKRELIPLYSQLNSPNYYSVYPPVCQFIFGFAAYLFPHSGTGFILTLRLLLLIAEAGAAWLMLQLLISLNWPRERVLWYFLHPLVIIETIGNLHFEGMVIFFVALVIWLLTYRKLFPSAIALALGAATKLLPILMLPLLIKRLGLRRFLIYAAAFAISLTLLFFPFISAKFLLNIGNSLQLYFHRFEFNASLYYILRAIGFQLTGYNEIAIIGPALALTFILLSGIIIWRDKRLSLASLPISLLFIFTLYYLCATTVHPWYLISLIALSIFTRFKFPLIWGSLAFLSYAAYRDASYTENLWLVGLEYTITIMAMGYEVFFSKEKNSPTPLSAPRP